MSMKQDQLTSESLARISKKVDRNHFVKSYVHSQRSYKSIYTQEGAAAQKKWGGTQLGSNVGNKAPDLPSSPLLKPRVPSPPLTSAEEDANSTKSSKHSDPIKEVKKVTKPKVTRRDREDAKKAAPKTSKKSTSKNQATMDQYVHKTDKANKIKANKKRERSHDSEVDARLAERRDRRRAKRAIVQPKPTSDDDGSEISSKNEKDTKKGKASNKPSKKSKGGDIAAGLALMYGFTAPNVGAGRLTLKPSSGLFRKGRASSPSKNKKSKKRKGKSAFSESSFLQSRACIRKYQPSEASASTSSDTASSDTDRRSPQQSRPSKKIKPDTKSKARKPNVVPVQESSSQSAVSSVTSQTSKNKNTHEEPQSKKAESVVWDIELPGHSLLSGSDARANTVVVNTRRRNWETSQVHPSRAEPPSEEPARYKSPQGGASSAVSLRPSESASQLIAEEVPNPDKADVSKYFSPKDGAGVPRDEEVVEQNSARQPEPQPEGNTDDIVQDMRDDNPGPESAPLIDKRSGSLLVEMESVSRHSRPPSRDSLCSLDRELQSVAGLHPHLSFYASGEDSQLPEFYRTYKDSAVSLVGLEQPDGVCLNDLAPVFLPSGDFELDMMMESPMAANEDELVSSPRFISEAFDAGEILDDEDMDQDCLDLSFSRGGVAEDDFYYADESQYVDIDSFEDLSQDAIPQSFWLPSDAGNIGGHPYNMSEDLDLMEQDNLVETFTDDGVDDITYFSDTLSATGTNFPIADYEYESSSIAGIEADAESEGHAVAPMEIQCFSQGRALLLGIANDAVDCEDDRHEANTLNPNYRSLSKIEEDVAKRMKGHWLPQRL